MAPNDVKENQTNSKHVTRYRDCTHVALTVSAIAFRTAVKHSFQMGFRLFGVFILENWREFIKAFICYNVQTFSGTNKSEKLSASVSELLVLISGEM